MQSTLPLWYQAQAHPFGICLEVSGDVTRAIQRLYRDRKADESLKDIKIKRSPTNASELWLIKK